ncbi:hypothetical protein ACWCPF_05660 [Streptomyces sp. NPDC001858]
MAAEEEPSRAAGGCVLVVLAATAAGAAFAIDEAVGILAVVLVGWGALYRSARRMSDSSATPPPGEDRPSCRECAGHEVVSVTPLTGQKGMSIYKVELPDRPGHTHVHIAGEVTET